MVLTASDAAIPAAVAIVLIVLIIITLNVNVAYVTTKMQINLSNTTNK